jgi:glycosyltransferase involved in cell wall biosynthesis
VNATVRHVIHVSQPVEGGVCRSVRELVDDQLARGWRVAVACPAGELAGEARELGAEHVAWPARRSPGPATAAETARLRRLLAARPGALVHLHSSKAGLAGRLALRGGAPTVFQPHGWSFYPLSGALRAAAIRWERAGARWAAAVLCVSDTERRRGEEAGIRARWEVVPNGIDARLLAVADRDAARARLGLGPGSLVVCLGRICRAKGQDLLLEAWPQVLARVPDARLALVGGGPDLEELRGRAPERVAFVGERADAADWLEERLARRAADALAELTAHDGTAYDALLRLATLREALEVQEVVEAVLASGEGS